MAELVRRRGRRLKPVFDRLEALLLLSAGVAETQRILIERNGDHGIDISSMMLPAGASLNDTLASLRSTPGVVDAEIDPTIQLALTPNDPSYLQEYGLQNISAPAAWNVTAGKAATVVAVIDTGVDFDHPDLYENIWLNQAEIPLSRMKNLVDLDGDGVVTFHDLNDPRNQGPGKITDVNGDGRIDADDLLAPMVLDASGNDAGLGGWVNPQRPNTQDGDSAHPDDLVGWNFVNNTNRPFDDHFHGTHVAGTIAAMTNNGVGVAGVNWQASIMPLKILDANGCGTMDAAVEALDYAVAHGAHVSNNSYGYSGGPTQAMATAIAAARAAGDVFVAAAGNSGSNNDVSSFYPACYSQSYDNVVAVAACDSTDQLAYFSNYGTGSVQIAAPGVNIVSLAPGGGYQTLSGTSMASPHVTGTIALLISQFPDAGCAVWIDRLLRGADPIGGLVGKIASSGRLDAYRALTIVEPTPGSMGPRVVDMTPNAPSLGPVLSFRLTFSEPIDTSTFLPYSIVGFSGPGGTIQALAVTPVPGTGKTEFDVSFPAQSAIGTYSFTVGTYVRDLAGNRLDQDGDGARGDTSLDAFTGQFSIVKPVSQSYTESPFAAIPGGGSLTRTLVVGQHETVVGLTVGLDIASGWDADLTVQLVGPGGQTVVLVKRRGGTGSSFQGTTLDDGAAVPISLGAAPFSGTYQPEGKLSLFDGLDAQGSWQLQVQDWDPADTATLRSWSLRFQVTPGVPQPRVGPTANSSGTLATPTSNSCLSLASSQMPVYAEGDDSWSIGAAVSRGGRHVAYFSYATDLVPNDTNGWADIFVRDTQTGTTVRANTAADGTQSNGYSCDPIMSDDGRYVAFWSCATNLVPGLQTWGLGEIYLKDLSTGAIRCIGTAADGSLPNNSVSWFALSGDGTHLAFASQATNLAAGVGGQYYQIYVKDLSTGQVVLATASASGTAGNADSNFPSLSTDGRYLAFSSDATNLGPTVNNGHDNVFVKDLQTGAVALVSAGTSGNLGNDNCDTYADDSISADGRYVTFTSEATNLIPGQTSVQGVYVKDLQTGTLTREYDYVYSGTSWGSWSPYISSDGRYLSFCSAKTGPTGGPQNFYLEKDLQTGVVTAISTQADGTPVNCGLGDCYAMSPDGQSVTLMMVTSWLFPDQSNNKFNIVEKNMTTGALILVSARDENVPVTRIVTGDNVSNSAVYSADGRHVAFLSAAQNLVPGLHTYPCVTAYLEDLSTGTIVPVEYIPDLQVFASSLSLSSDGRFVSFASYQNLDGSNAYLLGGDVYVKDMLTGKITRVSAAPGSPAPDGGATAGTISANARYVAFQSTSTDLVAGDTNGLQDIFVRDMTTGKITRVSTAADGTQANALSYDPVISADGSRVAFVSTATNLVPGVTSGGMNVYVKDLRTGALVCASTDSHGDQGDGTSAYPSLSADGRYVAFASSASTFVPGDTNGQFEVYVKDVLTGAIVCASTDVNGRQSMGGSSLPSISADGRTVAFSGSGALSGCAMNGQVNVFVKDLNTGEIVMADIAAAGAQPDGGSYGPSLRPDGRAVAFTSDATNLIANDLNRYSDVFLASLASDPPLVSAGPNRAFLPGQQLAASGSFVDFDSTAWKATVNFGDGSGLQSLALSANGSFVLNHVYASAGVFQATVSVMDDGGSVGTSTFQVAVGQPQVASLGDPAIQPENSRFTRQEKLLVAAQASWSAWVDYGDGTGTQSLAIASDGSFQLDHLYEDNGNDTLSVTLVSGTGVVEVSSVSVTVTNVAPQPAISGVPDHITAGQALSLNASATDPGPYDTAAGFAFTWSVARNGISYATGTGSRIQFTPDANGSYVVTLTATDKDHGSGTIAQTLSVGTDPSVQPRISGAPARSPEGTSITLNASAVDSLLGNTTGMTFLWQVTRDGNAFATGTGSTYTFTPDDNASYLVQLTATTRDGRVGIVTQPIAVDNVAPSASINGPTTCPEWTPVTFTATATDPSTRDTAAGFTYSWTVQFNGQVASGTGATLQFTPHLRGTYHIGLSCTDKDGATAWVYTDLNVTMVAPVPVISGAPASAPVLTDIILHATSTDPNPAYTPSTLTYSWSVTRNGTYFTASSGSSFDLNPHGSGTYVVTLSATDPDGRVGTSSVTITVAKLTPTVTWSSPAGITYGTALGAQQLTATASVPGTFLYTAPAGTVLHAGAGQTLSVTFTPNDTADYNTASASVKIDVARAALTVTAASLVKTYGAAMPTLAYAFTGLVNGDTAAVVSGAPTLTTSATATSGVGSYTIGIATGSLQAADYDVANLVYGTLTVARAHLRVTAASLSKIQGSANPPLTSTITGLVNGDSLGVVSGAPALSTSVTTATLPGTYQITVGPGTLSAANYDFNFVGGTLTVAALQAPSLAIVSSNTAPVYGQVLTFTASVAPSAGSPTPGGTARFQVDGVNFGPAVTLVNATAMSLATSLLGAGHHVVTVAYSGDGVFAGASQTLGIDVARAHLTATADAKSTLYGSALPGLTATFSGLVNGDTASVISGTPVLTTSARAGSSVGSYPITIAAGTLSAANYDFPRLLNSTLTINKAHLKVTADSKTRRQGLANPTLTATITGFVNGDKATVVRGKPVLSTAALKTSKAGSYTILVSAGTLSASNYDFVFVNGVMTVTGTSPSVRNVPAISARGAVSTSTPSAAVRQLPRWWASHRVSARSQAGA